MKFVSYNFNITDNSTLTFLCEKAKLSGINENPKIKQEIKKYGFITAKLILCKTLEKDDNDIYDYISRLMIITFDFKSKKTYNAPVYFNMCLYGDPTINNEFIETYHIMAELITRAHNLHYNEDSYDNFEDLIHISKVIIEPYSMFLNKFSKNNVNITNLEQIISCLYTIEQDKNKNNKNYKNNSNMLEYAKSLNEISI